MVPLPDTNIHSQRKMIDHDDEESSVESEYICLKGNESIPCLDDISLTSFRASNHLPRNTSFESDFSQASAEIDIVPLRREDEHKKRGRRIMVSNVPDAFVQKSDAPNGLLRDNALSGSCNSIKDQLHFGSIHEHVDYEDPGWSDMESSSEDDSDVEEKPVPKYLGHRFQAHRSTADQSSASDAESSVDDNLINKILQKNDSKEQMRGSNRKVRTTRHTKKSRKSSPRKVKGGVTSDPLLNRFLEHRHEQTTLSPIGKDKVISPRQQVKGTKEIYGLLGSILSKTDSLNHVCNLGRRVVKTIKDPRHVVKGSARRSSVGCSDELMQRFLSSTPNDAPWSPRRASVGTSDPSSMYNTDKILTSCDSLHRVEGKGQRVVRTRAQFT